MPRCRALHLYFQYYTFKGDKKYVRNCKDCKHPLIIADSDKELDRQCARCEKIKIFSDFAVYKYKGERRRYNHCRTCSLKKGQKLPTDVNINRWLEKTR